MLRLEREFGIGLSQRREYHPPSLILEKTSQMIKQIIAIWQE